MITADGWLDWAIRLQPSPPTKNMNAGTNPANGIFMHSAEGYASVLLDPNSIYGYNGQHSWHLSNLMDGRVFQHYPFTARCHHATAANQSYIGVENEGYQPKEKSLNEAQIQNAVRFINEISAWKGWTPKRPTSASDTSHTLWEHNEVVRLGGSGSSCPSGRIPWNEIMSRLGGNVNPQEELELADRRAASLVIKEIGMAQGDDYLYTPVSVAEKDNMLYIEFWKKDRTRPAEPVPGLWVRRP